MTETTPQRIVPVLAGGGTRLAAHVGVLTALSDMGIGYEQSSHPGEPPPEVLTEPDVNVSAHPALPIQPVHTAIASAETARCAAALCVAANGLPAVCGLAAA